MRLEHIGIAVKSIKDMAKTLEDIFGFKLEILAQVKDQKVRVAIFSASGGDAKGVKIELLEPMGKDSPIAKFLGKRGEGLHHLCFEVKDIEKTLSNLKSKGIKLINDIPRKGAFAKKIAFLYPIHGALIELCEK